MASVCRGEVLGLYRAILRRGERLRYTDREFFKRSVRLEFRKCSRDTEPYVVSRNIEVKKSSYVCLCLILYSFQQKAKYFLNSSLGGLI